MTPFTSNYETIKETSSKEKSLDLALISGNMTTPNQGKIQSTFLQSVRNNKFFVTLVAVVLATGIMAYNTNQVPSSNQFRVDNYAAIVDGSKGGGIIGSENGVVTGGGCIDGTIWPTLPQGSKK
eukprot:CAMPEP_0170775950 /NCGR_PEP_ID=MMETSP0733-20121128/10879_1 /TAXON_ID=186038 /ORGANISM="Fragilariopsis kerguelensis, Strain L26-C5" /LENGTH=123 /DNA_ID=CAMNT_0011118837 /DNA_START=73 /DNA_END=444 /DNA_ORIENTATION=-